jgi:hypothetical protein
MAAIVTTSMRIYAADQFIGGFSDPTEHLYLFIGRTLPWTGIDNSDNSPPTPVDSQFDETAAFRDMLSAKLIGASDVSLVVPRYNWTTGTVYTPYSNTMDLFDPTGGLPPFYVITDALNVYKCLATGKDPNTGFATASTVKPTGTTTSVVTNADGYQWKYMFTVNSADVLRFVTNEWVPVKTLTTNDGSSQWLVQQAAVPGTIDRIDMESIGSQYTSVPTVTIVGDGVGATATAVVNGGNVKSIVVTSAGSGYTWADIEITGGGVGANGAVANAIISPVFGHGSDPVSELGGYFVMINSKLTYDENGTFTVSNDFRRVGILKNPVLGDGVTPAVALNYNQMTRLSFGSLSGASFLADEVVTGSTSQAQAIVVDWDSGTLTLRVVEVVGAFLPGETVVGAQASGVLQTIAGTVSSATSTTVTLPNTAVQIDDAYTNQTIRILSGPGTGQRRKITAYNGTTRTATISPGWTQNPNGTSTFSIARIQSPDLAPYKGDILYLENRRPIARASDQVEDIKVVVEF